MQVTWATIASHMEESEWDASTAFVCGPFFLKKKTAGYKVSHDLAHELPAGTHKCKCLKKKTQPLKMPK